LTITTIGSSSGSSTQPKHTTPAISTNSERQWIKSTLNPEDRA